MKSFTYKALAVAAASACGASAAIAGSVTLPATPIKFAREAVTNTTTVTVPQLRYAMGVARAQSQNFTFIVKVPNASTAFSGTCPTTYTGTDANLTLALKRQSATECAYDVTVVANVAAGVNLVLNNLTVSNHSLGDGTNLSVLVNLADPGETARVDNSSDISATLATSTNIVSLSATADTHTSADVNFNSGNSPLFGFLAGGAGGSTVATSASNDTTTDTFANFSVNVATGFVIADGATSANANNALANVTLTVGGDFTGLITNFASGNSTVSYAGASSGNATVTYANSAAVFTLANTVLAATGATNVQVKLTTSATQSLGTNRVFSVSGSHRGIAGATFTTSGANSSWWTWGANAIELRSAFFNNADQFARFFFQNTGAPASYTATCYGEPSAAKPTTVTYVNRTGTLATGTTAIVANSICTFANSDGNVTRGSIVFTINAQANKVKGVYQQAVNGLSAGYIALERPYSGSTY